MKLIFKVEIDSRDWNNKAFNDSEYSKEKVKSMLFDKFYNHLTDLLETNDFSDYIEYQQSESKEKSLLDQLEEQMTEEDFSKLEQMLEKLRKNTKISLGYHRISGTFCEYEVSSFNNKKIVVLLEFGKVEEGYGYSERYRECYKIDREKLDFIEDDRDKDRGE